MSANVVPSSDWAHGKTMPLLPVMKPTNAAIATRPCLISACRRKPIVASLLCPQNSISASGVGFQYPTTGLAFSARAFRSSTVSMRTLAPPLLAACVVSGAT